MRLQEHQQKINRIVLVVEHPRSEINIELEQVFFMCAQHETKLGGESPLRRQVAGISREAQGGTS